ncbi:MAG: glycosyltransferase [Bacteroidales bacterium]|nr:glycosyltransferase [Bacteroidales bacterium]
MITTALSSVANQTYKNVEHLIIDGKSDDNTLPTIEGFMEKFTNIRLVSERDSGIYHAMNKGLDLSTGDWIYFMGAEDSFLGETTLSDLVEAGFLKEEQIVYGDVLIKGDTHWAKDNSIYDGVFDLVKLFKKNICHQGVFYPRSTIKVVGYYNEKYKVTSDWDYNIRCFARYPFFYTGKIIAIFKTGGKSSEPGDYSLFRDLPDNVIHYFQIDPKDGKNYQFDSPFFYPMMRYRDNENRKTIENLNKENVILHDKITNLNNTFSSSLLGQKQDYETAIDKLKNEQNSFWQQYREKEKEYQGYIRDFENEIQKLNEAFHQKEAEYQNDFLQYKNEQDSLIYQLRKKETDFQVVMLKIKNENNELLREIENVKSLNNCLIQALDKKELILKQIEQKLTDEVVIRNNIISENENEKYTILHSYTWRIGKIILAPLQFIIRIIKNR